MFYDKLNYKEDGFYSVVDQVELVNGEYKGVLNHDHVDRGTILIIDEEGNEIKDYFISDNPEKPWETEIELFGSKGVKTAYIHYNTKGDIVDADDINKIQDAISEDDGALDKVKEDIIVLKETKSDKRYVDRELDKKLNNDSFLETMEEIAEYTSDNLIPELKKYADDLFADVPEVFHDLNQNVVTEDMKPGDFKHGVTICSQSSIDSFPSIREYGVSITIRGVHASYAQLFITRYGDIWARRSGVIGEWNGDWYNSKKEIDKKADKDYVDKQIEGAGKVKSVNGKTGDVVLDATNIDSGWGNTIYDMILLIVEDFGTDLDKKADKSELDKVKQSGVEINRILVDALNSKGVWASTSESIKTNARKVNDIKVGDYSIGDIVKPENMEKIYSTPSKIWEFTGHNNWVRAVAVDNDGYVYSGGDDKKVMKISPQGNKVWELTGHSGSVYSVAVDSDGYVYSGGSDKKVMKISPGGSKMWEFTGHNDWVYSVAVDNDGYVYSGGDDKKVMKISPGGSKMWEFTGHNDWVRAVAVDSDGYVYSGGSDKKVMKISPGGSKMWEFTGHNDWVCSVAVDSDGYVYSGGSDKKVMKISSGKVIGYKIIA